MIISKDLFLSSIEQITSIKILKKVAIATSGGADSMCLTYLMSLICSLCGIELVSLIVDHGLRAESAEEANTTREFLINKNIDTQILTWQVYNVNHYTKNIYQKARDARYLLLTQYCHKYEIKFLFTGHNKEDQAETVIMRIMRGSGIDGICGIPFKTKLNGIHILRPLLSFNRQDIEQTLENAKWPWVNDPYNTNMQYTRAQIRQCLKTLPNQQETVNRLVLLSQNATRTKKFLDSVKESAFIRLCKWGNFGYLILDIDQFLAQLDEEISLRLLAEILKKVSGNHYSPRLDSLELLLLQIKNFQKWKNRTLWGCEILKYKNDLLFFRELIAVQEKINLPSSHQLTWDNRFMVTAKNLSQLPNNTNISVGAIGIKGLHALVSSNKVSLHNIIDNKILFTTPAIFANDDIIASPILNLKIQDLPDYYRSVISLDVIHKQTQTLYQMQI